MCERELETEQKCNILTPTLMAISISFLFSWAAQLGAWGLGVHPLWDMFLNPASHQLVWSPNWSIGGLRAPSARCWLSLPHLVTNGSGLQTDWISCALCYIIVQRPPSPCGCHKLHSFNPSMVKASLCYSSTGCTCYLQRCISYFDSPAGS